MALKKGYKQLLEEAYATVRTLPLAEARVKLGDPDVLFVDIRDIRELERVGMIPGAILAPQGMLEFMVDPESPYYNEAFGSGKEFVLYCDAAWASALAAKALDEMGVARVCNLEGGYAAWKASGAPTVAYEPHQPEK
ncbi:MAG: rhodanese-like domain-containing protein [Betaproteobacteria bacterium]|nr:rhodanese-like domain-containing protein [Betaproteobacteria bacterium]